MQLMTPALFLLFSYLTACAALAGPLFGFVPYDEPPFSSATREMCTEVLHKWEVQAVPQLPVSETRKLCWFRMTPLRMKSAG